MDSEEDDLPILPPSQISTNTNGYTAKSTINTYTTNMSSKTAHHHAVRHVIDRLASSREHINRTVLKPVAEFNNRPCINMKDFLKILTEKSKRQQNLDALYNLVEHDSDSIAGFVELNGLSFIDEWLDFARKDSDDWFALCILQFLAHKNLCITYEALQNAPIAKTVKYYIAGAPSASSSEALHSMSLVSSDSQCIPRLTDDVRKMLPSDLSVTRGNDNFLDKIDREVLHRVCKEIHDVNTIRYLQSQFASRVVLKWKKFVADWKKQNNRPNYRHIKFADEKAKPLISCTVFGRDDVPRTITDEQDKKRREKMSAMLKWRMPRKMRLAPLKDMDEKPLARGRNSTEKETQRDREAAELEEYSIGSEHLKDPKSLASNRIRTRLDHKHHDVVCIPLDSMQSSPSPDKKEEQSTNAASHKQAATAAAAATSVPSQSMHYAPHAMHRYSQYHPMQHHAYGGPPPHAHSFPPAHAHSHGHPPHAHQPPHAHPPHAHPHHNPYGAAPPPSSQAHGYGMHAPPPQQHHGYPPGMMQPPPQHGYAQQYAPPYGAGNASQQPPPPDVLMMNGVADHGVLPNGKRGRKREFSDTQRPAKRQKLFDESANDRDYRRKMRSKMPKEKHEKRRKRDRTGTRRANDEPSS